MGPAAAMLLGGGIGGVLGAFGGDGGRKNRINDALNRYNDQLNPLLGRLEAQANGTGDSLAEQQMRRALGTTASQMQGMAAGARPGQSQALARRNAMQQGAALQAEQAGQGALLRLQEQDMANRQLSALLQNLRQQELAGAGAINSLPTGYERVLGGIQGGMQAGLAAKK